MQAQIENKEQPCVADDAMDAKEDPIKNCAEKLDDMEVLAHRRCLRTRAGIALIISLFGAVIVMSLWLSSPLDIHDFAMLQRWSAPGSLSVDAICSRFGGEAHPNGTSCCRAGCGSLCGSKQCWNSSLGASACCENRTKHLCSDKHDAPCNLECYRKLLGLIEVTVGEPGKFVLDETSIRVCMDALAATLHISRGQVTITGMREIKETSQVFVGYRILLPNNSELDPTMLGKSALVFNEKTVNMLSSSYWKSVLKFDLQTPTLMTYCGHVDIQALDVGHVDMQALDAGSHIAATLATGETSKHVRNSTSGTKGDSIKK